jgi:3-hydroxy acid dehydrogenase/malonic semialdehyde reductase
MSTIRGSWSLVTGATSGFGEAIARRLAAEGSSLAITGRREDRLEKVAEEIRREHRVEVATLAFDVRDRAATERALSQTHGLLAKVDLLVNNAGLALALESVQA